MQSWGLVQVNLGNAVYRLGERERGTERLKEAIDAYQLAFDDLKTMGFAEIDRVKGLLQRAEAELARRMMSTG